MLTQRIQNFARHILAIKSRRRRRSVSANFVDELETRQLKTTFFVQSPEDANFDADVDENVFSSLQAAIDAAAANAGSDVIRIIGDARQFSENVVINDQSGNLSILSQGSQTNLTGDGSGAVIDVTLNGNTVTLFNFGVQNGTAGLTASGAGLLSAHNITASENEVGIHIENINGAVVLDDVIGSDNRSSGLEATDLDRLFILDSQFHDNGEHGLNLDEVSRTGIRNVQVTGNNGDGIQTRNGSLLQASLLSIVDNAGRGLEASKTETVNVSNGQIRNNGDTGLHVSHASRTTVANLAITGNSSERYGGGIYLGYGEQARISAVTVSNNSARFGGGIYITNMSEQTVLQNASIAGNQISGRTAYGAGIYHNSRLLVNQVTISENTATGEKIAGAGIYSTSESGTLLLSRSTVSRNKLDGQQHSSGRFAWALGAGLYVGLGADASVMETTLVGNEATMNAVNSRFRSRGGAAYKNSSSGTTLMIISSRIVDNRADEAGGVYGYGSGVRLQSVNLSNNLNGNLGGVWQLI